MIIQNATSGKTPLENSFVALDRQANRLGRCDVEPLMNEHLMPERPYELKLSVQGRPEARLQRDDSSTNTAEPNDRLR